MDLRSNPFQEGGNDAPPIVDPIQDDVTMAKTYVEVRVDELDELSELSGTSLELDELSDTNLELDELSDTTLELSELSDTSWFSCWAK
ncbi:hypothetical protein YC2023_122272 [Brassica napus]